MILQYNFILLHGVVIELDYVKIENKNCAPGYGSYTDLQEAKQECSADENCIGVSDDSCTFR